MSFYLHLKIILHGLGMRKRVPGRNSSFIKVSLGDETENFWKNMAVRICSKHTRKKNSNKRKISLYQVRRA